MRGRRVIVWSEGSAPKSIYPDDINTAIAEGLHSLKGWDVKTASLNDPDQGLPQETLTTSGDGKDGYDMEFYNWAASIREGKPVYCDAEVGYKTAVAIIKANEAIQRQSRVVIPDDLYTL